MEMSKSNKCGKSCGVSRSSGNGKGDAPRNNHSKKFKSNYEKINWSKKTKK